MERFQSQSVNPKYNLLQDQDPLPILEGVLMIFKLNVSSGLSSGLGLVIVNSLIPEV